MEKQEYTEKTIVSTHLTASAMGSGALPVLATPALVALLEGAAVKAIGKLPAGQSTVGIYIELNHVKASRVGQIVHCTAVLEEHEGKRYVFEVYAHDEQGSEVCRGKHIRVQIDVEKFMEKLGNGAETVGERSERKRDFSR